MRPRSGQLATDGLIRRPGRKSLRRRTLSTSRRQARKTTGNDSNDHRTTQDNYQSQTRRPIVCLAFVLPLILAYEIGAWLPGSESMRSGIDLWLDKLLISIGAGHLVILPVITTSLLMIWHHRQKDEWSFKPATLFGMSIESLGLGMILFWAASAYYQLCSQCQADASLMLPMMSENPRWTAASIVALGSGIYEELVFRLLLMVPAILILKKAIGQRYVATAVAMILVSLIFTSLHYNVFNPSGPEIEISSFIFRFAASMVFCVLFLMRGFGIAVGTHVTFDVLTQM
ncbi:MAG: CPBP family intramembrane glutamic endopeptidase [Planctomycetota bacterium]